MPINITGCTDKRVTVLEEAAEKVDGPRQADYGPPSLNFEREVGAFNAYFAHKLKEPLKAEEWPIVHEIIKLARLVQTPKHRDSWVDVAGYARTAEKIGGLR